MITKKRLAKNAVSDLSFAISAKIQRAIIATQSSITKYKQITPPTCNGGIVAKNYKLTHNRQPRSANYLNSV